MRIPKENIFKAILGLYRQGYQFIQTRCAHHQSDIFQMKLGGFKVICMRGEEAARVFYDPEKMVRKGAVPSTVQKTLTGKSAIHTTDGATHQSRKQMFISLMTEDNINCLNKLFNNRLHVVFRRWEQSPSVNLFKEAQQALCYSICLWAGLQLKEQEIPKRSSDFAAMVDAFGSMGLRNLRGRMARKRAEKWVRKIIRDVRENRLVPETGSALALVANYHEAGQLLTERMAAIELINILRPTVAVSWYIVFAAAAIHQHPECSQKFVANKDNYRDNFINEVRRFYPFAPFMGARVRQSFSWNSFEFPKGALVLLDMYGTNHDDRLWHQPDVFDPGRFQNRNIRPYDFLAQGGGDAATGQRCPGEWITTSLLETALDFLTGETRFRVPEQDLGIDLSRMPAILKSGFEMNNIRRSFTYTY